MLSDNRIPAVPGFYWAQWLTPWGEPLNAVSREARKRWEVVEVFANSEDDADDDRLMALLPGVEKPEPLSRFIWGDGPLDEPGDI